MASTKSLDGVIKRLWASKEAGLQNHFDLLFNRNVPHILEKIFLNLEDYDSFKACQDVCIAWRALFSSEAFKKRARELMYRKMGCKKEITDLLEEWDFMSVFARIARMLVFEEIRVRDEDVTEQLRKCPFV